MTWREYSALLGSELLWCRTFIGALSDMREKMRCYLDSPRAWAEGYKGGALEECGFLDLLRGGVGIADAYEGSRAGRNLSDVSDDILTDCFSRLGDGYLDTELSLIDAAIDKLSAEEKRAAAELPRKRKAMGAVLGACACGIVILVI